MSIPRIAGSRRAGQEHTKQSAIGRLNMRVATFTLTLRKAAMRSSDGLIGIYHNVSREYLHRYLWQFDFLWNNRQLNDGERTILAVKAAEGKRLMYKDPVAEREYIKTREQKEASEQKEGGEQLEPF